MKSPAEIFQIIQRKIRREWKLAFFTCFIAGLLVHMPILLSDIPNHDGLDSLYFDQNMITSGRWFLSIACGFSSYYTIPWVIGILGLVFLSLSASALCELLEVRKTWAVTLCSSLLAVFPALASTFAYVYTLDGYMLALLLAVLAVLLTKRYRHGFLPGAACLAFSLGIYQGYLPFVMILSIFSILALLTDENKNGSNTPQTYKTDKKQHPHRKLPTPPTQEKTSNQPSGKADKTGKKYLLNKITEMQIPEMLHYLYMGILGAILYYGILKLLLFIQGKELDTYQGINGMVSGTTSGSGLLSSVAGMYQDFIRFSLKGNVLFQNIFSLTAWIFLLTAAALAFISWSKCRKYWKNPLILVIMVAAVLALPPATNIVLLISPDVNYHLLMRYQWVLYAIGAIALAARENNTNVKKIEHSEETTSKNAAFLEWMTLLSASVLVFCYCITDNIAYSNLQKRYEKTYAYCVRLLDRIEQTQGYYPGIPIAMVGVVAEQQYPTTDLTLPVTSNMIGMNGDILLYRGDNYRLFIQNYLGATLNILPAEAMAEMYYSEEYTAMDSFPGADSIRIIDGIMYIKTENTVR